MNYRTGLLPVSRAHCPPPCGGQCARPFTAETEAPPRFELAGYAKRIPSTLRRGAGQQPR